MDPPPGKGMGGRGDAGGLQAQQNDSERRDRRGRQKSAERQDGEGPAVSEEPAHTHRRKRSHLIVVSARAGRAVQPAGQVLPAQGHLHVLRHSSCGHQSVR